MPSLKKWGSDMLKPSQFKALLGMYIAIEGAHAFEERTTLRSFEIGTLHWDIDTEDFKSKGSLPIHLTEEGRISEPAALTKTKRNDVFICLFSDYYLKATGSSFLAVLAHELGHYLAKHLEPGYVKDPGVLSYNGEKIALNTKRLRECNDDDKQVMLYESAMRAYLVALLRGGYLLMEAEADKYASLFVPIDYLVVAHAGDFQTATNPFVKFEKANRIANLLNIQDSENPQPVGKIWVEHKPLPD